MFFCRKSSTCRCSKSSNFRMVSVSSANSAFFGTCSVTTQKHHGSKDLWDQTKTNLIWLVVEPTPLKNTSQIGNHPQVGVKIRNIWNHQPVIGQTIWKTSFENNPTNFFRCYDVRSTWRNFTKSYNLNSLKRHLRGRQKISLIPSTHWRRTKINAWKISLWCLTRGCLRWRNITKNHFFFFGATYFCLFFYGCWWKSKGWLKGPYFGNGNVHGYTQNVATKILRKISLFYQPKPWSPRQQEQWISEKSLWHVHGAIEFP